MKTTIGAAIALFGLVGLLVGQSIIGPLVQIAIGSAIIWNSWK